MLKNLLIGRLEEKKILENALQSSKAEMVSIIGRRRVGKTFLVKSVYANHIDFDITGIQHATRTEQLRNFMLQIAKFSAGSFPITQPKDWLEAFYFLSKFLEMKQKAENSRAIAWRSDARSFFWTNYPGWQPINRAF